MPIAIRVSLEEDDTRGILRGISGNGEGFGEVWEMEDRARQKEPFELVKGSLTSGSPVPTVVLFLRSKRGRATVE